MTPIFVSSNPQEPTDRRAVCGRTARAVRREGRPNSIGRSYPYRARREVAILQRETGTVPTLFGTMVALACERGDVVA